MIRTRSILFLVVMLIAASTALADTDSLELIQLVVSNTNGAIEDLITEARTMATQLEEEYRSGYIDSGNYRSSVASIAGKLVKDTQELANAALSLAREHGISVKCYRVTVELAFIKVSVDPLIICDD
ncbi:MAG TPA: hypothetical protein DCE14_08065 [Kosmotogaceae bacterium]|nr:hypothetical protein [Kosmotogaceae bacterium]